MGSSTPLLNEYKLEFFWKRFPQTAFGGPKLKLGYDAPAYVYLGQIFLFLIPWAFGGIFTVLAEFQLLSEVIAIVVYGILMTLLVLGAQILSWLIEKKKNSDNVAGFTLQNNLLSEEDEVEFESCCGADTITYIVPRKKHILNIFFHALISGPMCGLVLWYLLPVTINRLYGNNTGATVILYILGWFTLCVAQYPLTTGAPPESATFRTSDTYELLPLLRSFYVYLFVLCDILARYYADIFILNQVLHVIFIFLPLLWTVGLLPPIDAFFLWFIEQILVLGFGGSPAATDIRLFLVTMVSACTFVGALFITNSLAVIIFLACMGYILSVDLGRLGTQILQICSKHSDECQPKNGFLWKWGGLEIVYHLGLLILVGGTTFVLQFFSTNIPTGLGDYFAYGIIGILVFQHMFGALQSVYLFFGILRNKLYPASVQRTTIFKKGKKRLVALGWLKRICLDWLGPFLMLAYLSVSISTLQGTPAVTLANSTTNVSTTGIVINDFWAVLGTTRAFRWIWQGTIHSLLEISVAHILRLSLPASFLTLNTSTCLLLVGICRNRFYELCNKIYFYFIILITSYSDKKQRRKSSAALIAFSFILFPVVFSVILLSVVISAPLLPLFTLPVFLIGYPRPLRFWPSPVGTSANICPDTVFYKHLTPELSKALRIAFATGSLGSPEPGNHYLARFQDRMIWIQVLERGYGFCTLSVKGLEMQETSCHTVEAARVDDMFEEAFEKQNGISCCSLNQHPANTLTPVDAVEIPSYSDARNVLTGIIDSPENLQMLGHSFVKSLIWVILHHTCSRKANKTDKGISLSSPKLSESRASLKSARQMNQSQNNTIQTSPKNDLVLPVDTGDKWESDSVILSPRKSHSATTARSRKSAKSRMSLSSLGDWSDDNESLALEPIGNSKAKINLMNGLSTRGPTEQDYQVTDSDVGHGDHGSKHASPNKIVVLPIQDDSLKMGSEKVGVHTCHEFGADIGAFNDGISARGTLVTGLSTRVTSDYKVTSSGCSYGGKRTTASKLGLPGTMLDDFSDADDLLSELEGFGLPAVDINQPKKSTSHPVFGKSQSKPHSYNPVINLAGSMQFSSPYSSKLSLPLKWREIPIEQSQLNKVLSEFPIGWYKHVITLLDLEVNGRPSSAVAAEISGDNVLTDIYAQITMACYAVVNVLGLNGVDAASMGPSHVIKVFNGDIPWSPSLDWLTEDTELLQLVLKAYRYAVKMMIDQAILGEATSNEEVQEYMEDYEQNMYIGQETDKQWEQSIIDNKTNLFSLGHDPIKGTYSSRVLTLTNLPVLIGKLNSEVIRGQWANLNLELLYFTNDDEERYSIQAHPTILRNLTVQSADPPLGYPIYASPPISVPTL